MKKNENNNTNNSNTNSNNNNNNTGNTISGNSNNNNSTSNNSNNSNTNGATQNSNVNTNPNVNKILNEERFTYVLTCLVGNEVSVHMKDGNEIKGLFHAFNGTHNNDKKDIDIALNLARVISKKDKVSGPVNKAMLVQEQSYKMIVGKNVKLDLKDPDEANNVKDKFKIDTDISESKKNVTNANRELKKWIGDSDFDENKLKLENSAEPWDQFERNRKLYGVTTTYKEEIYTTNLDLNKIPHHVKMQADKIAKELEKRGMHLDPEDAERDNENVDEEDLFGAVRQVNNNQNLNNANNKDKYNKKYVKKEESNKSKPYQSKYHLPANEENEKNQSSKKDSEKKFTNAHQIVSYTPTGSNDDRNVGKKNKPIPTSNMSKRTNNRNAEFIGINALNLEPALPKLDEKTRTEWTLFKNQTKHKTNHRKDKTTEKQEFITAAREFNERMSNSKANLNKKEGNTRISKDHSNNNHLSVMSQKGVSNIHDKSKFYGNDSGKRMSKHINENDNKMGVNNSMVNFNNVHYNASAMMNNPNMRPIDFYFMNFNNLKNNMIPPNMGEFYQNIPIMHNAQNQMFPCANPHMFKNEGMPYPNMKMNEMMPNDFYNPQVPFNKEHSNEDLSPFPSKRKKNRDKKSFKDFMNTALNHAKEEECVNAPVEFRCNHNYSYKNILGEIPKCTPMNPNFPHANNFSNNMGIYNNMGNIPVGFPYVPMVSHGMNGHYLENPLYFNPYVPNFHHNNGVAAAAAAATATATAVPPMGVGPNQPYPFNIPPANMDGSYTSNKNMNFNMNMNMFPMRNNPGPPMHNPHMNIPIPSCVGPAMNYPMNSSAMNMMNNPNVQNPNMNMPPYPPEMVLMNAQKYANSQNVHTPYMPQYQYQNCYTPSHGVN